MKYMLVKLITLYNNNTTIHNATSNTDTNTNTVAAVSSMSGSRGVEHAVTVAQVASPAQTSSTSSGTATTTLAPHATQLLFHACCSDWHTSERQALTRQTSGRCCAS